MIGEFAQRHVARGATWGRIIGLTSGGDLGFAEEVSYGAAKANYTMSAAASWPGSESPRTWSTRRSPTPAGSATLCVKPSDAAALITANVITLR